jgi:hypothetical protein
MLNSPTLISYFLLGIGWVWLVSKVAVQWHYHFGFESRREQEANMLVNAVCNTVEGASLANEFAKCEEARIILRDTRVVWMKAFEKTLESTFAQVMVFFGSASLSMTWNFALSALLVSAVGLVCKFTTEVLERDRGGIELFSPIARHRLLAPSFVDIGNYQLEEKKMH